MNISRVYDLMAAESSVGARLLDQKSRLLKRILLEKPPPRIHNHQ